MAASETAFLVKALRAFKVTPEQLAIGTKVDEFVARVGTAPFSKIAERVSKTDFRTTTTLEIPEVGRTFQINKPLDLLRELEAIPNTFHSARLRASTSASIAVLKKGLEDETPKALLKDLSFRVEDIPSEEEFLDPTKAKKREINWDWFKQKGATAEEISKLQATLKEHQSEEQLAANLKKIDEDIAAVAKKFDGVVEELFKSWLFQPGNIRKLLERSANREATLQFYLNASAEQIADRHPEWQEQVNKDIMESKWAAFEDPADPQWEAKRNFVPKYPKDVAKEHAAHGHH